MTLYELTNEYKRLYDMAEEMDLSPYDLMDTLDGMDEELSKKADGYGKVIRQMEADSDISFWRCSGNRSGKSLRKGSKLGKSRNHFRMAPDRASYSCWKIGYRY